MEILDNIEGFEWDDANLNKNWIKHKVAHYECEEMFFNEPLIAAPDISHSEHEDRYYTLGKTNNQRLLFVVFTIRNKKIRVISARDMSIKERRWYK